MAQATKKKKDSKAAAKPALKQEPNWPLFALAPFAWNKALAFRWKAAWLFSLFGLLYSLYLTSISFLVLDAFCPYCLTSAGLMGLIFITVTWQRPATLPSFRWAPWLAKSGGAVLAAVLALHL